MTNPANTATEKNPSVYRFNNMGTARHFQATAKAGYAVLLGGDGLFWVPTTNRETGRLRNLGYEIAPR